MDRTKKPSQNCKELRIYAHTHIHMYTQKNTYMKVYTIFFYLILCTYIYVYNFKF